MKIYNNNNNNKKNVSLQALEKQQFIKFIILYRLSRAAANIEISIEYRIATLKEMVDVVSYILFFSKSNYTDNGFFTHTKYP